MAAALLERGNARGPVTSHMGMGYDFSGPFLVPQTTGRGREPLQPPNPDLNDAVVTRALDRLNVNYPRSPIPELHPRNATIAGLMQPDYRRAPKALREIAGVLRDTGAVDLLVRNKHFVTVDGQRQPVAILKATETGEVGDMVDKVWIRDQTQAAQAFFEIWKLDNEKYKKEGEIAKTLLMSALSLMSTDGQLKRFKNIIADEHKSDPEKALISDYRKSPQIAFKLTEEHLNSVTDTDWRMLQDAWQMLGITSLDAMKEGLIGEEDLAKGHKKFLSSMVPYLAAVDFSNQINCGSWEENPTVKTSVVAIETALLHRVQKYMNEPGFEFLQDEYQKAQAEGHLPGKFDDLDFGTAVNRMIQEGLERIADHFPDESPKYNTASEWVKHRGVDISLLYLLDYGIPQLLEQRGVKIGGEVLTRKQIEQRILDAVETLYDPQTHGYKRYIGDSYGGLDFDTDEKQQGVQGVKDTVTDNAKGGPIDLHHKQFLRYELIEPGHEATWFHPNSQIVNWAAKSYRETGDKWYADMDQKYYNRLLATLTGEKEYTAVVNGKGKHEVQQVKPFRWAESTRKRRTSDGRIITTIGPFVPLNWGTGLGRLATVNMEELFGQQETAADPQEHVLVRFSVN